MAPTDHLTAVAAELLERLVATQGPGGHWGDRCCGARTCQTRVQWRRSSWPERCIQAWELPVPRESIESALIAVLGSIDEDGVFPQDKVMYVKP